MITTLLQTGIYTVPEAARLTGVSPQRIRRWLRGYEFKAKHGRHLSKPVWHGELDPIDHSMALGFLDLLEIRCVDAFRRAGVSWQTLRQAHGEAEKAMGHFHPFCTNRFATDGRAIFVELRERNNEVAIWDIANLQQVFVEIIRPFLRELEFAEGEVPKRWWPMGRSHRVALDPRRNFGQPIVFAEGIPTSVLARSAKANGSAVEVARWFEVDVRSVHEAIEYERKLAA